VITVLQNRFSLTKANKKKIGNIVNAYRGMLSIKVTQTKSSQLPVIQVA
jgi:hypothetical protein